MKMNFKEPVFMEGGIAVDERGVVTYCNGFDFDGVKRFYTLTNFTPGYVRAWHGHKTEVKYVVVTRGSCMVCCAPLSSFEGLPGDKAHIYKFIMSYRDPGVLYIPAGYANGHMALEQNTDVLHFSTLPLEDTKGDDVRFPADFFSGVWEIKGR